MEILDYFSEVAIPSRCGARKPDPRPFGWILGRLGARPEEALYVGDDDPDALANFQALGLRTLLATPGGNLAELLDRAPSPASLDTEEIST